MFRAVLGLVMLVAPRPAPARGAFVLAIDPGHGGAQKGAKGPGRLWEKAVSLAVAQKLAQVARKDLDAEVVLTRETDAEASLAARMERANASGAELFVSVHANSMPPSYDRRLVHGVETFFLSADATDATAQATADRENDEGGAAEPTPTDEVGAILDDLARTVAHTDASRLAYRMQKRLTEDLLAHDRGVKQAPFRVLMGARMPAVLVEIGFISHPDEGRKLGRAEYQMRVARSIAAAITEFRAEVARRDRGQAAAEARRAAPRGTP